LMAALQMAREVADARHTAPDETKPDAEPAATPAASDENVTALSAARHTK
jgi:hypothetical protein